MQNAESQIMIKIKDLVVENFVTQPIVFYSDNYDLACCVFLNEKLENRGSGIFVIRWSTLGKIMKPCNSHPDFEASTSTSSIVSGYFVMNCRVVQTLSIFVAVSELPIFY